MVPSAEAYECVAASSYFELGQGQGFASYGLARALRMLLDVLAGLGALHDTQTEAGQPFVHGELVPALMRVDRRGVARLIPIAPWHVSGPGTASIRERWGHLAPERLLGDVIDQRADVFSAGVLLWEALAGRRLFESDNVETIVTRLMGSKVSLPDLPAELRWAAPLKAVALCALAADPEQRFASAAELSSAIEAVAGDQIASHADVAKFFGAREPGDRPSVIEQPAANAPAHHSSLSALVSPVQPAPAALVPSSAPVAGSPGPRARSRGQRWMIAALACGSAVLALTGVARYSRVHSAFDGAHAGSPGPNEKRLQAAPSVAAAPPSAAWLAAAPAQVEPVALAPGEPSAPPGASGATLADAPAEAGAPRAALPAQATAPPEPGAAATTAPAKPQRSTKAPKGPAAASSRPKAPAKRGLARDKEADKYGI